MPFDEVGHELGGTLYAGSHAVIERPAAGDPTEVERETVWAAEEQPGEERFVSRGNWATYVEHSLGDRD